jgi:hypothetical protein
MQGCANSSLQTLAEAVQHITGQSVELAYVNQGCTGEFNEAPPNVPLYWVLIPKPLTRNAGENRFVWNLRYTPPLALRHSVPISAIFEDTPETPEGALVAPGTYEVRLTVSGKPYREPLEVAKYPRVETSQEGFERQVALARKETSLATSSYLNYQQAVVLREAIASLEKNCRIGTRTRSRPSRILI